MICDARPAYRLFRFAAAFAGLALMATPASSSSKDRAEKAMPPYDTSRIVSIGGAVTEILYGLGADKNVVAIDSTSIFPKRAAAEKKNVGYMRALSPEGVLGLAPTLILAVEGSGPEHAMAAIESAGIPLVFVPDPHSGDGILEKVGIVARATGKTAQGDCMIAAVRSDLQALDRVRAKIDTPARVMFVLSFVKGRAMVAGRKTAADGIIKLAGGVNAVSEYEGYKPIDDEAVVASNPDAVLVMQRSSAEPLTAENVFAHPAFSATRAAANRAFVSMDGLYLLGFGPRTARAARDLAAALHPSLGSARLPTESATPDACRQ
jgi:iron complex transport system substrate-binding protein